MKKVIALLIIFFASTYCFGQRCNGTILVCPKCPQWKSNSQLYADVNSMYETHARGPNGCWWSKNGNFTSYEKGEYIFKAGSRKRFFTYKGNNKWFETTPQGLISVSNPFGRF